MNEQKVNDDLEPSEDKNAPCEIFCFAAIADDIKGTVYTDLPGRFPARLYKGNQYIFLTYVYDANAIIVRPMKSRTKEDILEVFKDVYEYLKKKKFAPKLHIMDNKCSKLVETFLRQQKTDIQFVKPHQHCVNAAKQGIQTFKEHFIAGLCTVNKNFPMQLWCDLLEQAQLTINLLRQARVNNKLSAYAILEGTYNFNKVPLAPPGTRTLVFKDNSNRRTWAPHAQEGLYVGPAPNHYRCYKFWMPKTKGYNIAQTARFFPTYSTIPTVTSKQYAILCARDLLKAMQKLIKAKTLN